MMIGDRAVPKRQKDMRLVLAKDIAPKITSLGTIYG